MTWGLFEPRPISPIGQNNESSSSIVSSRSGPMRQHHTRENDGRFSPIQLFKFSQKKKNTSFLSSGGIMRFQKSTSLMNKNTSLLPRRIHHHSRYTRDSLGVVRFLEPMNI